MARLGIGSHARPTVSNRSAWSWASRSSRTPVVCGRVPGPSLADRRWFGPPLTTASTASQATVSQRQTQGRPQPHQAPPASRTVPLPFSRRYGVGAVGIMTQGKPNGRQADYTPRSASNSARVVWKPRFRLTSVSGIHQVDIVMIFRRYETVRCPLGGSRLAAFSPRARAGFAARQDLRSRFGAGNGGRRGLLRRCVPEVHQVLLKEPGSLGCDGQACYAAGIAE